MSTINSNEALKYARQAAGIDECTDVGEVVEQFVDVVDRCRHALAKAFVCIGWDQFEADQLARRAARESIVNTAYTIIRSVTAERERARIEAEALVETLQNEMRRVGWRPSDGVAA